MQITLLGTGTSQGIPVIGCKCPVCTSSDSRDQRLRSSVLVETGELTLVIDTGPDFRQQMLCEKVSRLDAVLITHEHKDHLGGLDDVRAYNFMQKKPMDVYARADIHPVVMREFDYAFDEVKYPGVPQIQLHEVTNIPFEIQGTRIIPVEVLHGKLPVFGYRIGGFCYLTDLSSISPEETEKIRGTELLIITALRQRPHHSHFNLEKALELIAAVKPEKALLTHISHYLGLHAEVDEQLPAGIGLAYDGMKITL